MKFNRITACLDMFGCPNRCKHCWIGSSPNGNLTVSDLEFVAEQFRTFADYLEIYDWYREPDYKNNYKQLWNLCNDLSDGPRDHFELISVYRIVRDKEYVKWLYSLGVRNVQLTLFGGAEKTDYYTGRKNAYNEILEAVEILIKNRISPRIQFFVNKDNIEELPFIEKLIKNLNLDERCKNFDGGFSFFIHQGSCCGENEKLNEFRLTPEDVNKIPEATIEYTKKHFNVENIMDVFGRTERELYDELLKDNSIDTFVSDKPVFYIDKDFNVYPNISAPENFWLLGNLKLDGAEIVLKNYKSSDSVAQRVRKTVPLCDIVRKTGDHESLKLFTKPDYKIYLLNKYCRNLL